MGHASRWVTLVSSCTTDVAPAAQAWTRSGQRIHVSYTSTHPIPPHPPATHTVTPRTTSPQRTQVHHKHPPQHTSTTPSNATHPVPCIHRIPRPQRTHRTPRPQRRHPTPRRHARHVQNPRNEHTEHRFHTHNPHPPTGRNHSTHPTKGAPHSTPDRVHVSHQPSHAQALPTHPHWATSPTGTLHENRATPKPTTTKVSGASQPHHKHSTTLEPSHAPAPQWVPCRPRSLHPERTHRYRRYPKPTRWTPRTGNAWTQARKGCPPEHQHTERAHLDPTTHEQDTTRQHLRSSPLHGGRPTGRVLTHVRTAYPRRSGPLSPRTPEPRTSINARYYFHLDPLWLPARGFEHTARSLRPPGVTPVTVTPVTLPFLPCLNAGLSARLMVGWGKSAVMGSNLPLAGTLRSGQWRNTWHAEPVG